MDLSTQQININFSSLREAEFLKYLIENGGCGHISIDHRGNMLILPTLEAFYKFYGKKPAAEGFDEWNW